MTVFENCGYDDAEAKKQQQQDVEERKNNEWATSNCFNSLWAESVTSHKKRVEIEQSSNENNNNIDGFVDDDDDVGYMLVRACCTRIKSV